MRTAGKPQQNQQENYRREREESKHHVAAQARECAQLLRTGSFESITQVYVRNRPVIRRKHPHWFLVYKLFRPQESTPGPSKSILATETFLTGKTKQSGYYLIFHFVSSGADTFQHISVQVHLVLKSSLELDGLARYIHTYIHKYILYINTVNFS